MATFPISAERGAGSLRLLVRAGELFHQSLDLEETLANVARMAVESFAQLCLFDLIDEESGKLYVSVGAHRDPEIQKSLKAVVAPLLHAEGRGRHPAQKVVESGRSFFVPRFDDRTFAEHAASDEHEAFMRRMHYGSKIVVAVKDHADVFGALTFVRVAGTEPFDATDVQAAEELGRRAGLAVANAKRYRREQQAVDSLQRTFLNGDFPQRGTLQFHALYRGAQGNTVGGDWYDAFELGRKLVVTVGDVTGQGLAASQLMVQLRQWIRLAAVVSLDPARMLELVNRGMLLENVGAIATAFIGVVDAERAKLRYASAGHPPPFLKLSTGEVVQLEGTDVPLGAVDDPGYLRREHSLADAALLLLYTDGLTEIDRDPVAGERAIRTLLESQAILHSQNPARFLERALVGKRAQDDLAILSLRFGAKVDRWRFDVGDSAAAYAIKRNLLDAVAEATGEHADIAGCELIFGELIGNALRYAPGPLSVSLESDERGPVLHLVDEGPGFDGGLGLPDDLWAESGRGLFLVEAIAADLAIERLPHYGSYIKVRFPTKAP